MQSSSRPVSMAQDQMTHTDQETDNEVQTESSSALELSVIVAAHNEQDTIETCVERIFAVYPQGCEVLVVDGGSDETGTRVAKLSEKFKTLRYIRNENDRGKGHAIRTGIEAARAPVMAQLDADLQFLPEELPALTAPIIAGQADVTLGSRFTSGATYEAGSMPGLRVLGNRVVSLYASLLSAHRLTDVLAGMKAWTREASDVFALQSDGFSYEVEIALKGCRRGLRVQEVPVSHLTRQEGDSNVRVVRDGLAILLDTTRFRLGLK
jgi:glycosyltransferase involved in cell wall biosynthesis